MEPGPRPGPRSSSAGSTPAGIREPRRGPACRPRRRAQPGGSMDSGRLEAFSDGVFAVAITIRALNLSVVGPGPGHKPLADQLLNHWPAFAAYAVSFATIGIIWVNHHTLFKNFSEIDRTLLFLNLLLLFFVVSIPFATSTIAAYLKSGGHDASLAAAIFQGVFEGMSISFGVLFWWSIRHEHMKVAWVRLFWSDGFLVAVRCACTGEGLPFLMFLVSSQNEGEEAPGWKGMRWRS